VSGKSEEKEDLENVKEEKEDLENVKTISYLPLRFAVGWMWLDGGLRKAVLKPAKLDPNSPSFVLNKVVTFLPHAGIFKGALLSFLSDPSFGATFLAIFSAFEIIVGLALIIGVLSRFFGFIAAGMALSLAPAAWLGSTCEDEWQILSLLLAGAVSIMIAGAGRKYGVDEILYKKYGDRPIINAPLLKYIRLW
jgi:thiosulfate dehydrogenase [quinone] large subunit